MKAFVPDTNFWLHVKRPVDFGAVAGARPDVVVVPTKVLEELDLQAHGGRRGIRKRAREVVMELRHVMRGGLRTGSRIEATDDSGVRYWFVPDAKTEVGSAADKVIVATAEALRGEGEIVIATSDGAMEMTASLAGLDVLAVPADQLEADEADPMEQEVAALKRRLEKLEREQQEPLKVEVIAEVLFPEGDALELVRLDQPSEDGFSELQGQIQVRLGYNDPSYALDGRVRMYNASVPPYASKVTDYLKALARWEATAVAAFYVQILIINRSGVPIDSAVLVLHAPEHVTFADPLAKPDHPKPLPTIEELLAPPGFNIGAALGDPLSSFRLPITSALKPAQTRGPWVRKSDTTVESTLDDPLRPDYEEFAGKIWIAVEPEFPDSDLEIPFVLYSAARSKPVSGTVLIRAAHKHETWVAPDLPGRDQPQCGPPRRKTQYELEVIRFLKDRR